MKKRACPIRIAYESTQVDSGTYRLEAKIDNELVFFESNVPLVMSYEALGTLFLLPAMHKLRHITLAGPADIEWINNTAIAMELVKGWWSMTPVEISAARIETNASVTRKKAAALFFTGGVDSFYSLIEARGRISHLVNVEGFDVALQDFDRQAKAKENVDAIARAWNISVVNIRTNLKESSLFNSIAWEKSHGAALAGLAHLLTDSFAEVRIASSDVPGPHGSHPELDPLWSSSTMNIIYDSPFTKRLDKVRSLSDHSHARQHLKVCWENRSSELNCGFCEKCARTRAQLFSCGAEHPPCFPATDLKQTIDALPFATPHLLKQWEAIQANLSDSSLQRSIEKLLRRSRRHAALGLPRKAVVRTVRKLGLLR